MLISRNAVTSKNTVTSRNAVIPATTRVLAIAALSLLASCGVENRAVGTVSEAPQNAGQAAPTVQDTHGSCPGMGDVFELEVPGTYTAFAIDPSGPMLTEVRGADGQALATTQPTATNVSGVDVVSAARFDVPAPQVFEVETGVTIHVQDGDSPYELVLVRIGGEAESNIEVRPPVEPVVSESGVCANGDSYATFKIRTDAVHSAVDARQVFVIDSPAAR